MMDSITDRQPSLALLPGIVDRPEDTLARIMAHPRWRWVLPALLSLLGLAIYLIVAAPHLSELAEQQQTIAMQQLESQLSNLTEAQRQQMQEQMTRLTSPTVLAITGLVGGALQLAFAWIIGSAILYFSLLIAGRGVNRYGQVLAGYSWTWLPLFLRDLVNAGWVYATGKIIANPGLSYFFSGGDPTADARNPLWVMARHADLFILWRLVLVYFLVRAASGRQGGLWITLVYATLSLALRVIPALLLSSFPGL